MKLIDKCSSGLAWCIFSSLVWITVIANSFYKLFFAPSNPQLFIEWGWIVNCCKVICQQADVEFWEGNEKQVYAGWINYEKP